MLLGNLAQTEGCEGATTHRDMHEGAGLACPIRWKDVAAQGRGPPTGPDQVSRPAIRLAAVTVFFSRQETVIGPTPLGTGVM